MQLSWLEMFGIFGIVITTILAFIIFCVIFAWIAAICDWVNQREYIESKLNLLSTHNDRQDIEFLSALEKKQAQLAVLENKFKGYETHLLELENKIHERSKNKTR